MIPDSQQYSSRAQRALKASYNVVVIGGGPAGSTVGALVAELGHDVLILERATFPRFHVGESLIPETYWTLKRLGMIERLRHSAAPKKYSVQFVTDTGKETKPFYFDQYKPHESSQTWQVWRDEFDQMLLDNAIRKGCTAQTGAHVLDVCFDGERARGVRVSFGSDLEKVEREIAADVIVDATGQSSFLANRLRLKRSDPLLQKGAVWSYFQGAHRGQGKDEGATIILQTESKKSWFWYIPLADDVTSIGCTGGMDYMFRGRRGNPEEIFQQELERCPGMQWRLQNATRSNDYFSTKDFSYHTSQGCGPGWVLVGDALGFIDPVYSSGVFLALKSGEFAADAIHDACVKSDFSSSRLGSWQTEYERGVDLFRRLVYAFYTPGFSFAEFLNKYPQYRNNLVDILIGDVFKPGVGEMFEAMGDVVPPSDLRPISA